jgi:hypothetical protein
LLLLHVATYSFEDLLIVNGLICDTFQSAAIERNLISDSREAKTCFNQCKLIVTPRELRLLFVNLTLEGYATLAIYNDEENQMYLYRDFLDNDENSSINKAKNDLLKYISSMLTTNNHTNSDFGLPEPEEDETELDLIKLKYTSAQQHQLFNTLMQTTPPTPDEQLPLINKIKYAIDNNLELKIILQGKTV